jgi:hypothetical protein
VSAVPEHGEVRAADPDDRDWLDWLGAAVTVGIVAGFWIACWIWGGAL